MAESSKPGDGGAAMHLVSGVTGAMRSLAKHQPRQRAPANAQARQRQRMLDWHRAHGSTVSLTARHFGVSRPTVYRWQSREDPRRPESLADRSSRPTRVRRPTWGERELTAVKQARRQYPRWGKDKLVLVVARRGVRLSVSMVGRILRVLQQTGQLVEPLRRISTRKRRSRRPYAVRKPRDYAPEAPGDLVQLDTLDIRPEPGVILKQFTARDVVSRWDVLHLASRATATTATAALDAVLARMPFPVRALQVDGGSEFMAGFEAACRHRGVRLFVLPPRSPKLNGCVERANRTHTEEFYECSTTEPTVTALSPALRRWERVYNTVRPHQALGYRTPKQFLHDWLQDHHRKETV
jgi:transposase InsO family protein